MNTSKNSKFIYREYDLFGCNSLRKDFYASGWRQAKKFISNKMNVPKADWSDIVDNIDCDTTYQERHSYIVCFGDFHASIEKID